METARYLVPWPKDSSVDEVMKNPPSLPKVEECLNDPSKQIHHVEEAKVHFYTQDWYCITIQYQEKDS